MHLKVRAKLIWTLVVEKKGLKWLFGTPRACNLAGTKWTEYFLSGFNLEKTDMARTNQWDGPLELTFKQINRDQQASGKPSGESDARFCENNVPHSLFFDVEKRLIQCTRTVYKLRALLDKEDNIPELKVVAASKSGEKEVKDRLKFGYE